MACELMWPYIVSTEDPSVEGYLIWAKNKTDAMVQLKYEQVSWFYFVLFCIHFL